MFKRIITKEAVDALDQDLLVKGYLAGLKNNPDHTQTDQAYWHGYMNGQVDGKWAEPHPDQFELAQDIVNKRRAN